MNRFKKLIEEAKKHSENQGAFSHWILEQRAWHGSPHIFDYFDLSAIGTGEGAQAHGWGLYFAKEKAIAEGYRQRLARGPIGVSYKGNSYVWEENEGEIVRIDDEYEYVMPQDEALTNAIGAFIGSDGDLYEALDILYNMIRLEVGDDWSEEDLEDNPKAAMLQEAAEILENEWKYFDFEDIGGSLFEVEIPDDDVLLDEDLPLNKQPEKVQEAVRQYYRSRPDSYMSDESDFDLGETTGDRFYRDVVFQMRREGSNMPEKDASLLLNSLGIKGIVYDGRRDGSCAVIFDDKVIEVIERYNQEARKEAKGSYDQAQAMIRLFEGADTSTFMHEMSHHYLAELAKLAKMFPASEAARDYDTIMRWASWEKGQAKAYAGTASAKEFQARDEAIRKAEKKGDALEVKRLKDVSCV